MRRALPVLLLALLLAFGGCVYFNTFYLARQYYDQAKEKEKLSTGDKVSPEAATLYDKSIEKSTKIIANHSGSRWMDDAIYLIGMSLLGKRDYDGALKKFEELQANYPKSKLAPDALFMSGICHQKKRNFEQANAVFERVMTEYPKFSRRDEVLLIVARGAAEEGKRTEAVSTYRELVRRYGGSSFIGDAYAEMGEQYVQMDEPDSARMALEQAVRTAPDDDARAKDMVKLATVLSKLGRTDEAIGIGRKALTATRTPDVLADAHLANAAVLRDAGMYDESIKAYQEVIDLFPRTLQASQAQFEIGYAYEVYKQDPDAARDAYERVKQQAGKTGFSEQADLRSKNLEKMQQFSQELGGVGDEAAAAAFNLAELKFFQFEKPEEALDLYAKVETDYPQSLYAAKAAFARAWILRESLADTSAALEEYQHLVDTYPRSAAAAKAREVLGLPPVFFAADSLAAADSAAVADSLAGRGLAAADTAAAHALASVQDSAAAAVPGVPAIASAAADTVVAGRPAVVITRADSVHAAPRDTSKVPRRMVPPHLSPPPGKAVGDSTRTAVPRAPSDSTRTAAPKVPSDTTAAGKEPGDSGEPPPPYDSPVGPQGPR